MPSLVSPWTRGRRGRLVLASAGFSLHQACEASVPIAVGIVIDTAIAGSDPLALGIGVLALGAVFLVLLFSWRLGELTATGLYVEMDYTARRALVSRLLNPLARPGRRGGEVLSTLTADVAESASVAWTLGRGIALSVAIAVAATGLLLVSVPLGLAVLVVTPLLALGVHFATGPLERRSAAEQAALADSSALSSDLLSGLRTVRGLGAGAEAERRFRGANDRTLTAALRAARAEGAFAGVSALLSGAFLVALAAAASAAMMAGAISVGQLVTVMGLAQFLQWPMTWLGFAGAELAKARASRRRVDELAGTPMLPDVGPDGAPQGEVRGQRDGEVRFDRVRCDGIERLDLVIEPGALVGLDVDEDTGLALGSLLAGTTEPDEGTVLVDGRPLRRPPMPGAAAVVSAPHDAALLTGTVADNVGVRDREDIAEAAALADVLAVGGWDRPVGERGRLLSGGQRQRVALARALASDAAVLVLREPTTSVDAVTQARIADGIRAHRAGRTTILLTRSSTLLGACDRVVTLSEGRAAA